MGIGFDTNLSRAFSFLKKQCQKSKVLTLFLLKICEKTSFEGQQNGKQFQLFRVFIKT